MALLGPSGCGKTTLLRILAGLTLPDSGEVSYGGRVISGDPPHERQFGFVFQNYALFPHMTVGENVGYGLRVRGVSRSETQVRVREALARVDLRDIGARLPSQLSGGQQQRVALARAIIIRPRVLLLDEPLGALDKKLREEMEIELRLLQKSLGVTTLFVTHDQEEALTLADQIAVMKDGRILQVGGPSEIYNRPSNRFVANFIGTTSFIPGRLQGLERDRAAVVVGDTVVGGRVSNTQLTIGQPVDLAVRPEKITLSHDAGIGRIPGNVREVLFQGHRILVIFESLAGLRMQIFVGPGEFELEVGRRAYVSWQANDAIVFETLSTEDSSDSDRGRRGAPAVSDVPS